VAIVTGAAGASAGSWDWACSQGAPGRGGRPHAQGLAELAQAAQERQQGANLMTIEADLARDEAIDQIVSKARGRSGWIDILSTMPVSAKRRSAATIASARSSSGR